jgi:putative methyltransferase (TIGR04325 family)
VVARSLIESFKKNPIVRSQLVKRYEQFFAKASDTHLFRGVYGSFEAAAASAPDVKPIGYNQVGSTSLYRDLMQRVLPADYAALFWLQRILPEINSLVDFGGHVGIKRYAFRKYLDFADDFKWVVSDVQAVAEAGRKLADAEGMKNLQFVSTLADAPEVDVFYASGSLQYLQPTLTELLRLLPRLPKHLLLNGTPCSADKTFYTLNNIGSAFCPYKILERDALMREITELGYSHVDAWTNPGKACVIPHQDTVAPIEYCGFYCVRQA